MENAYLVYLLQGQIHSVFSVFGGWRVEYTASVYFVYLFQGQIHSVFGVFASVHLCISHLGPQVSCAIQGPTIQCRTSSRDGLRLQYGRHIASAFAFQPTSDRVLDRSCHNPKTLSSPMLQSGIGPFMD